MLMASLLPKAFRHAVKTHSRLMLIYHLHKRLRKRPSNKERPVSDGIRLAKDKRTLFFFFYYYFVLKSQRGAGARRGGAGCCPRPAGGAAEPAPGIKSGEKGAGKCDRDGAVGTGRKRIGESREGGEKKKRERGRTKKSLRRRTGGRAGRETCRAAGAEASRRLCLKGRRHLLSLPLPSRAEGKEGSWEPEGRGRRRGLRARVPPCCWGGAGGCGQPLPPLPRAAGDRRAFGAESKPSGFRSEIPEEI